MNKLRLLPLVFSFLCLITLSSCGKDDDADPSRKAILSAGVWQGNKFYVDGDDWTSFVDIDNTSMEFKSDGTYIFEISGDSETGTWELTSNDQKILMDKNTSGEATADILKLTNTALNISFTEEDPDTGEDSVLEIRFIRD